MILTKADFAYYILSILSILRKGFPSPFTVALEDFSRIECICNGAFSLLIVKMKGLM
jgi:hypothetical protein